VGVINLIVAGGGEGTYKNLYPITQSKDPNLGMRIAVAMDILPQDQLHPKMQEIIASNNIAYLNVLEDGDSFPINGPSAGVVMTPNATHLHYATLFAERGIPVYVEKPAVTTIPDLEKFLQLAARYPNLVYAAEYCVEGKGLGVLAATGVIKERRLVGDYRRNPLSLASEKLRAVR